MKANTPKQLLPADDIYKPPDWLREAIAVEYGEEQLDSALAKLSTEGEVILTDSERRALLAWHSAEKRPQHGRPRANEISIALWCRIYESCMPLKVAVDKIMNQFGVSRATVFTVRRKFLQSK
jgi:hypothetical protein